MKILISSDWHLGAALEERPELKEAQQAIPRRVAALCREEGCDLVLLAGDLFDAGYDRTSFEGFCQALAAMEVPVFIAPGNHDFCGGASPYQMERFPKNVHVFRSANIENVDIPALGCTVYGAGYESMDCPGLLAGFTPTDDRPVKIGILHGDPVNAASPCCPITRQQVEKSGLDLLALGHIHKGDSFRAGKTLCLWSGSPMGRDFGECGDKGVWIAEIGERVTAEFRSLGLPCFYAFSCEADALDYPACAGENYYRITVTGYRDEAFSFPEMPGVTWVDETHSREDIWQAAGEDHFLGAFFSSLKEKYESGDQDALRAAEISRRLLNGERVPLC